MTIIENPTIGCAPNLDSSLFSGGAWESSPSPVPAEMALTLYVNKHELVTILCSPDKLNCLVLGYLYSEGVITSPRDILSMRVCQEESLADVRLSRGYVPPRHRTLTSGCGGGVSLNSANSGKVVSALTATPEDILSLMKQMQEHQQLFKQCGGVHCSALCDNEKIILAAEDIGRHNTLDKILGECLLRALPTRDRILLTTGRISSEMLLKSARMQTPVIVSRGTPTERAVTLGQELGLTVIGYARAGRLTVYSHRERIIEREP